MKMNNLKFIEFIIKYEKLYEMLDNKIKEELSTLDEYNMDLNLNDTLFYNAFSPIYIGKKNNKKCYFQYKITLENLFKKLPVIQQLEYYE